MKKFTLLLTAIVAVLQADAQQYKWGKIFEGPAGANIIGIKADNSGNVFVIGQLNQSQGTIDLDPGAGTHNIDASYGSDFLAKYTSAGDFVWANQYDEMAHALKLQLDPAGNPVVAGKFGYNSSTPIDVDFDPSSAATFLTAYGEDLFIAKYASASGALLTAKQIQTVYNAASQPGSVEIDAAGLMPRGTTFQIDNAGNMTLCGSFSGYADFDINTDWGPVNDGASGTEFIVKYTAAGNIIYSFVNGGTGNSWGFGSTSDAAGNVYFVGRYSAPYPDPNFNNSIFLIKISNTGTVTWAKEIMLNINSQFDYASVGASEYPQDIRLDNAGNIYIYGKYWHDTNFDPDGGNTTLTGTSNPGGYGFLAKYSPAGTLIWAKKFGGTDLSLIHNLEIAPNNRIIAIADVQETFSGSGIGGDLDMGSGTTNVFGTFIAQYDTAANLLGSKQIADFPFGFAVQNENIFLGGGFIDSVDLNMSAPTGKFLATQAGYLAKYNQCMDNTQNISASICQGSTYTLGTQTLTTPGIYNHTFTVGNCDSVVVLTLAVTSVDTAVAKNNNILTANATGATYQWLNCANNTPIQGATGKTFTPSATGNYKVVVTKNGCSDTSNCYNVNITGINQPEFAKNINIFPNPAQDKLFVSMDKTAQVNEMYITDLAGRVLQTIKLAPQAKNMEINVNNLNAGIYILKLTSGNEKASFKFVKK